MESLQSRLIKLLLPSLVKSAYYPTLNVPKARVADVPQPSPGMVKGCSVVAVSRGGVPCLDLVPAKLLSDKILIFFHGGGYVSGPNEWQWRMLAYLCRATGRRGIMVDYRLAPEHLFPAALDDMMAVYRELLKTVPAADICFLGDSAGGGLVMSAALRIKQEQLPLPARLVLLSPFLDTTVSNPAMAALEPVDKALALPGVLAAAKMYAGAHDPKHPYLSPVYGDLAGLPPILLMIGTHDILMPDCRVFKAKAEAAGVALHYEEWDKMFHVWMGVLPILPEARRAIRVVLDFCRN